MVFDTTPLSPQILDAVARRWRVEAGEGERLYGGEESAAYRIGDHVVRIGPSWRSDEELEWAHLIASRAADALPEAIAPIRDASGATVVRVDGRPISLWLFRSGTWPPGWGGPDGDDVDDDDTDFEDQAAQLLARLHRVLMDVRVSSRPGPGPEFGVAPELEDLELDHWLLEFDRAFDTRQPLHGDFYAGNTLAVDGRLVGLLDWDESFIGPPERELAWAAWAWGDGLYTLDLSEALRFIDEYVDAGGIARRIDEIMLRQLARQRIRREVRYARAARLRGVPHDADDFDYEARQLQAFTDLRPAASAMR